MRMAGKERPQTSAATLLTSQQITVGVLLLAGALACIRVFGPIAILGLAVDLVTLFYAAFVGLKLLLWAAATQHHLSSNRLPNVTDPTLPRYTIMVPMRCEGACVERLVKAISRLRYPIDKLEVLLLIEADDPETQAALDSITLPAHVTVIRVPTAGPATKPKALDYGWSQGVKGDLLVIYDAEDTPDPDQLLQAVASFREAWAQNRSTACVQARLVFWNPRSSWISTLYFAEYMVHFNWMLGGLARLGLIPPLGGTSNHFLVSALADISHAKGSRSYVATDGTPVLLHGPWDEHNVTEDAALAADLALSGHQIGMLDSVTFEEAPVSLLRAYRQRSRWLQGFLHTGVVHCRYPLQEIRRIGLARWVCFELTMFGAPLSYLLLPLTWGTTALYLTARLANLASVTGFIHNLFPPPVFYPSIAVSVIGNLFLFLQQLLVILHQQERSERSDKDPGYLGQHVAVMQYGLVPRLVLTPLWWLFTSLSAYRATIRLLTPWFRSAWDLSAHGHAAQLEADLELKALAATSSSLQGLSD